MTELQKKLVNMLSWFHDLCEKEGITYFALGGTALGAIRHKGFIPWDDDIDVGIPRKDYEKLLSLSDKINKNPDYYIEFPSNKKDFVYAYAKVYDKNTILIENTRYKTKRGIYLDVFPIDGIGNTEEESISNFKKIDKYVNLLCTKICALNPTRKLYKNISIILARLVPDCILGSLKLIKKIDTLSQKYDYDECEYVANLVGNWHEKEIMKKEWIGNLKLCDFENVKIYTVENNHAYLTHMYGDYMTPPPVEKQITHHDYLHLDLQKSYLE